MEITNPRRILLVGPPDSGIIDLLQGLTGSTPTLNPGTQSLAGLSHTLAIVTPYYSAQIPIWIDEIPLPSGPSSASVSGPSAWAADFLDSSVPEAKDVLSAINAFIVCFRKPVTGEELLKIKGLLGAVEKVVKEGCGYAFDGVCLAVGMRRVQSAADGAAGQGLGTSREEWEDVCEECGFEFVDGEENSGEKNEFGEPTGIARLKEALEANEWASNNDSPDLDDVDFDDSDEDRPLEGLTDAEKREKIRKLMLRVKRELYGDEDEDELGFTGDESQVESAEKMQAILLRLQALRANSQHLTKQDLYKCIFEAAKLIATELDLV